MSIRLDQIQRQWDNHGKYQTHTDPAAAEMHQIIADLLDELDELEDPADHDCNEYCDHEPDDEPTAPATSTRPDPTGTS